MPRPSTTSTSRIRRFVLLPAFLHLCSLVASPSGAAEDKVLSPPAQHLMRAFAARYDCALSGVVEIEARRGAARALHRRLEVASKIIGDRLHTYVRFREPQYIRGVAFLGIEARQSGGDAERFVFLPSLRRIRRVSGGQSGDAFLGTDLSYHDFERQQVGDFEVEGSAGSVMAGEPSWELLARPAAATTFARVHYLIAQRDHAILRTRYFKRAASKPYKIMEMPRSGMLESGHCRIPSFIRVSEPQRRTSTELVVTEIQLDRQFDDSLFSMAALETSREVPSLPPDGD